MGGGPHDEELRPIDNEELRLAKNTGASLGVDPPLAEPLEPAALAKSLTTTSQETLSQNHLSTRFWTADQQNLKGNKCVVSRLLSFRVICYVSIDNEYKQKKYVTDER